MKGTHLILLLLLAIAYSYGQVHNDSLQTETYLEVPLTSLMETPGKYHGKKIQVQGYFICQFEGTSLYINKGVRLSNSPQRGFWIDFSPELMRKKDPQAYHERYVIIRGTFNMKEHGHMGLYAGAIMDIVKIDSVVTNNIIPK